MEMILRIVYANKIEDFDLSRQRQSITVGAFRASPSGGWNYRCGEDSGMLRPGDVILIDEDKSIAALVLEKHQGRAAWLDWRDGLTIGRKIGNQIALKDGLVSSRHCQIVRKYAEFQKTLTNFIGALNTYSAAMKAYAADQRSVVESGTRRFDSI